MMGASYQYKFQPRGGGVLLYEKFNLGYAKNNSCHAVGKFKQACSLFILFHDYPGIWIDKLSEHSIIQ
jgi:hypothetical protein